MPQTFAVKEEIESSGFREKKKKKKKSLTIQVKLWSVRSYDPQKWFLGNYYIQMRHIFSPRPDSLMSLKPITNIFSLCLCVRPKIFF